MIGWANTLSGDLYTVSRRRPTTGCGVLVEEFLDHLGVDGQLALGMNPGMPVSTTGLSLTRVLIPSLISLIASSGRVEI